jgi:poly(3-hydroxybutyrate) depolymerase
LLQGKWLSDPDANLKIDDKTFIASFVDGLSERLCIDTDRIYATGLGVGAGLVHFLACDPLFSKRISAFAITNAALYTGLKDNRKDVKDLVSIQWEKCKPSRIPTRILAIHSENNTVNDYFGRPGGTRKRMPVVQWLVEWAMRNECGGAEGQPEKEHEDDMLYLTPLEGGTIHEGAVHMNKLQQAYYKCYETTEEEMVEKFLEAFKDIDLGLKNTTTENETTTEKIESSTTEEGEDKEEKVEQSDIDSTKESTPDNLDVGSAEKNESDIKNDQIDTEKAVENAGEGGNPEWKKPKKDRGIVCLMHYFIKNNGHGWPRVLMKNGSTEQIGSEEVQPTDETPIFDSTVTILDWFKQHKLSDEGRLPAAERMGKQAVNPEGLEAVLNQLGENQDGESTAEHDQESSPENKEAKQGGEKQEKIDRVKDEL